MFCAECGVLLEAGSVYCGQCGKALGGVQTVTKPRMKITYAHVAVGFTAVVLVFGVYWQGRDIELRIARDHNVLMAIERVLDRAEVLAGQFTARALNEAREIEDIFVPLWWDYWNYRYVNPPIDFEEKLAYFGYTFEEAWNMPSDVYLHLLDRMEERFPQEDLELERFEPDLDWRLVRNDDYGAMGVWVGELDWSWSNPSFWLDGSSTELRAGDFPVYLIRPESLRFDFADYRYFDNGLMIVQYITRQPDPDEDGYVEWVWSYTLYMHFVLDEFGEIYATNRMLWCRMDGAIIESVRGDFGSLRAVQDDLPSRRIATREYTGIDFDVEVMRRDISELVRVVYSPVDEDELNATFMAWQPRMTEWAHRLFFGEELFEGLAPHNFERTKTELFNGFGYSGYQWDGVNRYLVAFQIRSGDNRQFRFDVEFMMLEDGKIFGINISSNAR